MTVAESTISQFEILKKLLRRSDIEYVVNACDAGREGELIFRSVYHLAGCSKPIKRLWISSMEEAAVREGFANLKPGENFAGLYRAALCRAKADWLVGINATRLFSLLYGRTLHIGRVMSPHAGNGGGAGSGNIRLSAGNLLQRGNPMWRFEADQRKNSR